MAFSKTIFFTCFHTLASRNMLTTDVFASLKNQSGVRIIIFAPAYKKSFYEETYGAENIVVEGIDENFPASSAGFRIFRFLTFAMIPTYTMKLRLLERLHETKTARAWIEYLTSRLVTALFSRVKFVRQLVRNLDRRFSPHQTLHHYFDRYKPCCVFSTDAFFYMDALFVQAAKAKKTPSIAMVRSWDNTTSKGLLRAIPDKLIVNNKVIREEAMQFHDIKSENVFVSGIPQFDVALRGYNSSREDFFKKIGLDSRKRLVLFAPAGQALSNTDWQICEILKQAAIDGKISSDTQFLVRSHPADPAGLDKFQPNDNFAIERPGTYFVDNRAVRNIFKEKVPAGLRFRSTEITAEDNKHLLDSLYHSDLLIYVNSTIGIDSLIFDKPQIMIEFDGWEKKHYLESVKRYHEEDHMIKYLNTGAAKVVRSPEELFYWIKTYLENPSIDQKKRQRALKEQLEYLDGQSGKRVADFIINQII